MSVKQASSILQTRLTNNPAWDTGILIKVFNLIKQTEAVGQVILVAGERLRINLHLLKELKVNAKVS